MVFISGNSKDFAADGAGTELAPDLIGDLVQFGAGGRVHLVPNLTVFREQFVAPATVAVDDLLESLNSATPLRAALDEELRRGIASHRFDREDCTRLEDLNFDIKGKSSPVTVTAARLIEPLQLHQVSLYSPRLVEGQVAVELEAELDLELELDVSYWTERERLNVDQPWPRERIVDREVSVSRTPLVGAEVTYEPGQRILRDVFVHHVGL